MKHSTKLSHFLTDYKRYETDILLPTYNEISKHLRSFERPEYWMKYMTGRDVSTPSPIRMTMARIKHPEQAVDKILRKPELFPLGLAKESIKNMHDAIGVRLIVYFYSQLPLVDKELRDSSIFELSDINPPEAFFDPDILERLGLSHIAQKTKESGYTSIHYTARLKKSEVHIDKRPFFEIQLRTLAQELWCELEHVLSYKPENRTHFSAKRRFHILSREIGVLDEHFNLLYEDLIHNQEIASYSDSDILNFENMPKVLMEIGIQAALTDLNPALKILFSRGINTIGTLLKVATPRRLMTIRNTYISEIGHAPSNLELISSIAMLKESDSKETEIRLIKSRINYQRTSSYRPSE